MNNSTELITGAPRAPVAWRLSSSHVKVRGSLLWIFTGGSSGSPFGEIRYHDNQKPT
jgi:hypothetical protein